MPDWEIQDHSDLHKIPDITMPRAKLDEKFPSGSFDYSDRIAADLKHRITRLRRMGLVKGDRITNTGRMFIGHCLENYGNFKGRLALCFSTDPASYPYVQDEETAYGSTQPQWYWDQLTEALDRVREQVFECESWINDNKLVDDAIDITRRFGTYTSRRVNGKQQQSWSPNWDCWGGNGWGATDQQLVSDYVVEHFDEVLGLGLGPDDSWDEWVEANIGISDYSSQAEAFADTYYELWGLYLWALHVEAMTSPEEIMYQWRWNLAQLIEPLYEEAAERLCLDALGEEFGATILPDICEFAADSDEAYETVVRSLKTIQDIVRAFESELAQDLRDRGAVVIAQDGSYVMAAENGASLVSEPFVDAAVDTLTRPQVRSVVHNTAADTIRDAASKAAALVSPTLRFQTFVEVVSTHFTHGDK